MQQKSEDTEVLKITSDESEAVFAQIMVNQPRPVKGVVRYHRVLRVVGSNAGLAVYAIWRELARDVGYLSLVVKNETKLRPSKREVLWWLAWYVANYKRASSAARELVRKMHLPVGQLEKEIAQAWSYATARYAAVAPADGELHPEVTHIRDLSDVEKMVVLLAHCDRLADDISKLHPSSQELGKALIETTRVGLLLCDVHLKNVGRHLTQDRWIITDPGHMLSLGPSLDASSIDQI